MDAIATPINSARKDGTTFYFTVKLIFPLRSSNRTHKIFSFEI